MAAPVVHFEVIGKDFEQLKSFYGELFEWELQDTSLDEYALVQPTKRGIGGGVGAAEDPYGITFYVQVEDIEAALEKAESMGGKQIMSPTEVAENTTIAQLEDPEGHRIGLVKG
jgi:predicted enzyme related to lactoylglutathione lyase